MVYGLSFCATCLLIFEKTQKNRLSKISLVVIEVRGTQKGGKASMEYDEFYISKLQAQEFAKAIFADIEDYVNEHLEEYQQFLIDEGLTENEINC